MSQDILGTIKMFFNKTYDNKNNKSLYPSKKNDNVKFLLLYLYNLDNINRMDKLNIYGEINIINMKNMFNLLKHYHEENKIKVTQSNHAIIIKIGGMNVFDIKANITKFKKSKIKIYINLDFIMFEKLIEHGFKIPLHLDSKCLEN